MRYGSKVDRNQTEIVAALRAVGASVQHLHNVAGGCPDIAVGYKGKTYMMEIKDGSLPPSGQKLTPAQEVWHRDWQGHAAIVNSPEAALAVIGVIPLSGQIS